MVGCCEHGDGLLGSIQYGDFFLCIWGIVSFTRMMPLLALCELFYFDAPVAVYFLMYFKHKLYFHRQFLLQASKSSNLASCFQCCNLSIKM